jgi:2-keto-3-deoxy-L-rhamnonate aldolase RhmA
MRVRAAQANEPLGSALLGMFLLWSEPGIAELCAWLDLDFVVIDMEAGALDRGDALRMAQALAGWRTATLVRVPSHEKHVIEHALDLGAHGLVVPKVNTREEAEEVASATRFPPAGTRGVNPARASSYFGTLPDYFHLANSEVVCIAQIETRTAVRNAADIARTPGIDGLFVGMGDLAMDLGHPGRVSEPDMGDALEAVQEAARSSRKLFGAFAYGLDLARSYVQGGHDIVAFGNEIKLLREIIVSYLERIHA